MNEVQMIYGSVCSGIEAATVAWETLGWTSIKLPRKIDAMTMGCSGDRLRKGYRFMPPQPQSGKEPQPSFF